MINSIDAQGNDGCEILACQITIPPTLNAEERDRHVDSVVENISRRLQHRHADLVVLPELSTIDYARKIFNSLNLLAETLEGSSVDKMKNLARRHRVAIVLGMPRLDQGEYFISQVTIDSDGELLDCYDKLHICQYGVSMEKEYFQRGNRLSMFQVAGFRFAPIICYDIRIPELCRSLTINHKVDCILHCGAYFRDESFASWHAFATTRAMENQVYLLSLNRAGENYGDSLFCLPWMDDNNRAVHFKDFEEDFRYISIERRVIEDARQQYTFLADRLDDYNSLSAR